MLPLMKRGALARWSIRLRGTASIGGTSATTAIREIRWRRVLVPELDHGHVGGTAPVSDRGRRPPACVHRWGLAGVRSACHLDRIRHQGGGGAMLQGGIVKQEQIGL